MAKRLGVIGVVSAMLLAPGCSDSFLGGEGVRGSGNVVTESRAVSGFDAVELFTSGDVEIDVNGTESLTIEAEDNILPLLTSDVSGGRLQLEATDSISPTRGITYRIGAAALTEVAIFGSGDVVADGIETDRFEASINGSGTITPTGTSDSVDVRIRGSGDFEGADLTAAIVDVTVMGSGSVVVNASAELDVTITGSGNVAYIGNPTISQTVTGSGDVSPR